MVTKEPKKTSDQETSEYFDTRQKAKKSQRKSASPGGITKSSPSNPSKQKGNGKRSTKKDVSKLTKLNRSIDDVEHSDSDFGTTSSQLGSIRSEKEIYKKSTKKDVNELAKLNQSRDNIENSDSDFEANSSQLCSVKIEKVNIDSSSSESDFEDVEETQASTSGYNSKLSTSSTSDTTSKPVIDFSQVDHKNFDISMLAKIEGVELQKQMESGGSEDDSDWEKVEGSCSVQLMHLLKITLLRNIFGVTHWKILLVK